MMSRATEDVLAERDRQLWDEGWTHEHDWRHQSGELPAAAAAYALHAAGKVHPAGSMPSFWPWDRMWWKPKNQRRDLVRAGAMIIAEIERIDRESDRLQQNREGCAAVAAGKSRTGAF